jgi:ribosomal protein L19
MGQPAPLFACLDAMVGDAVRIDQMASAARSMAVQNYSIEHEVERIHQVYTHLIKSIRPQTN